MLVVMTKHWGRSRPGVPAEFPEKVADDLIRRGLARRATVTEAISFATAAAWRNTLAVLCRAFGNG